MLLSRLVRSSLAFNCRRYSSQATPRNFDPLRILFCGSDEFSAHSLRALHAAKEADSSLIESIDVLHRPGKLAGRGMRHIKEVSIKKIAREELGLETHAVEKLQIWPPPKPFDLMVVASFGLLIPAHLIDMMNYGGINVHPSLLPDLRGPAPIHHTLLKKRPTTGVSIQTLDRLKFDRGDVIAQTPRPGIFVPADATIPSLRDQLGIMGGELLVDVLKKGTFLPPQREVGWYAESNGPIEYAHRIDKPDSRIDIETTPSEEILHKHRILGDLWCILRYKHQRIILNKISLLSKKDEIDRNPGFINPGAHMKLHLRTIDGALLDIEESTVPGGKKNHGNAHIKRQLNDAAVKAQRDKEKAEVNREREEMLANMSEKARKTFILEEKREKTRIKKEKVEARRSKKREAEREGKDSGDFWL